MAQQHSTVLLADAHKARLADKLGGLCRIRLHHWRREFQQKFPRHHGRIIFGNGTELIEFGATLTRDVSTVDIEVRPIRSLAGLLAALKDIWEITDGYLLVTPDDFEF